MSKSAKSKKSKVPKLTEAEYADYISSLKGESNPLPPTSTVNVGEKNSIPVSQTRELR